MHGALAEFELSYRLRPNPRVLYNVGLAQKGLHRYGEAILSLERYLAENKDLAPDRVELVKKLLGEMRPFDEVWPRLGLIILVVAIAGIAIGLDIRKRRQASAALEQAIATADEPEGDARVLQETMKDALATLRAAKGR